MHYLCPIISQGIIGLSITHTLSTSDCGFAPISETIGALCPTLRDSLFTEVGGLVFLDSAHEEQALRLHELDPAGPAPNEIMARVGWYVKPGQRLEWHTEVPLIVLGRGTPFERTARAPAEQASNACTRSTS